MTRNVEMTWWQILLGYCRWAVWTVRKKVEETRW